MYIQGQQNKKVSLLGFSKFLKQKKRQENFKCLTSDGMKAGLDIRFAEWPICVLVHEMTSIQENTAEFHLSKRKRK